MNPFVLSACLLAVAALLLGAAAVREFIAHRTLAGRMGAGLEKGVALRPRRASRLDPWVEKIDPEVPALLDQLAWRRSGRRTMFFAVQLGVPLAAAVALVFQLLLGVEDSGGLLLSGFIAGLGFLLPKRVLVSAVKRRKAALSREMSTLIPMLRMLFEVGMTVEQALRVLMTEGKRILPEFSKELRGVIGRVDAGLELGPELREMAAMIEVDDVTDCVTILEQLLRQGGGAMASLMALKNLLDDRRATTMQERVSKLSAKMSAVMVGFLFPALLIVLAGPGFMAIFRALGGIGE